MYVVDGDDDSNDDIAFVLSSKRIQKVFVFFFQKQVGYANRKPFFIIRHRSMYTMC